MDETMNYQPQAIPNREQLETARAKTEETSNSMPDKSPWEEKFAEVMLDAQSVSSQAIPVSQSIQTAPDKTRALFYEMRQIARQDMSYLGNPSKIFYFQAKMMQDFTDDYSGQVPFSFYFPYYQLMGYGQLRTYFTWRTRVRKGDIQSTSVSYAFVYIYELLACIGSNSPQESLQKLVDFWRVYRKLDNTIDKYVLLWMKDFHVYYPLEKTFLDFAAEHHLQKNYSTVFVFSAGRENSFAMYSDFSKYDVRKSIFYTDETKELIADCFYFLLTRLRGLCRKENKKFEDFVFYPIQKEVDWRPFAGALFYPFVEQEDRTVSLSEREVYTCTKNRWTYRSVMLTDAGRGLVGYLMKEMESVLRETLHFRYKINASPDMCDARIRKRFGKIGISIPKVVAEGIAAFFAVRNRTVVHVDTETVGRIRSEALETQEKLIVPEENIMIEKSIAPVPDIVAVMEQVGDEWQPFVSALTDTERSALSAALRGEDLTAFAHRRGMMLEVLLDSINEKAMDTAGDTVLELCDNAVVVYEEYKEKLTELVG